MVHQEGKPVGCLAWHPRQYSAPDGENGFSSRGWTAFAARDKLNDRYQGPDWKLRVIPLWLKRVFSKQLARRAKRGGPGGPGGKEGSR